ncbi:hypothetical protein BDN71DRAFT_1551794 [Pleurotus eryngii]|uniref:F-box domain-containing protein n=1 Tax=Pleurotus eryngii TaxID=5323 RepID=A0A9P5ZFB4_PLEER|nr:hypothetical protein BDN71DRAFT_1551794 [Pleurotus eryngii]
MSTLVHPLRRRGINKLPFELLVEILMLASTAQYDAQERRVPPSHSLLAFSHVCGTWRTAVRTAPQLWTIISGVESPPLMREIIVLSKKLPLVLWNEYDTDTDDSDDERDDGSDDEVNEARIEEWNGVQDPDSDDADFGEFYGDEDDNEEKEREVDPDGDNTNANDQGARKAKFYPLRRGVAPMLFVELHRMTAVRILVHCEDAPALPPLLTPAAPLLTSLDIKVRDPGESLVLNPFGGKAPPRLKYLALDGGFEIPWDSPIYTNLTYLYLDPSSDTLKYQHGCSSRLFADALAQMSSLETLGLVDCLPEEILYAETALPHIHLPRLTDLTISDYATNCVFFLRSIKCELDTLRVTGKEDEDHEDWPDYGTVYLALFADCKEQMALPLTRNPLISVVVETGLGDIRISGLRQCQNGPVDDADTPLDVTIIYDPPDEPDSSPVSEKLIAHALNMLPPHEGRSLQLELHDEKMYDPTLIAARLDELDHGIRHDSMELAGCQGQCWCMRTHCFNVDVDVDSPDSDVVIDAVGDHSSVEDDDVPAPYKELLAAFMLPIFNTYATNANLLESFCGRANDLRDARPGCGFLPNLNHVGAMYLHLGPTISLPILDTSFVYAPHLSIITYFVQTFRPPGSIYRGPNPSSISTADEAVPMAEARFINIRLNGLPTRLPLRGGNLHRKAGS